MISLRLVKGDFAVSLVLSTAFLFGSLMIPDKALAHEFKVVSVYDGDTIRVEGYGTKINVRLAGIDAPEVCAGKRDLGQPYCDEARSFLSKLVLGKAVDIRGYGHSKYNLMLGVVYLGEKNINLEMVREGLAEVYRGKSPEGLDLAPLTAAEKEAVSAKKGMWALGDEYVSPKEYRKSARAKSACAILLYGLCDEKGQ